MATTAIEQRLDREPEGAEMSLLQSACRAALRRAARARRDLGQSIVLVSLMMPALIGGIGLAVDYGRVVIAQRKLQNAADAAALAGVPNLPTSTSQATTDATTYLTDNGFTSGSNGDYYPNSNCCSYSQTQLANDTITVSVGQTVPMDFMAFLGVKTAKATAAATAQNVAKYGTITACDTTVSNSACFPYIVWNTWGTSCQNIKVGDVVMFHDNSYASDTGATSCGWTGNSNNQKGFLRMSAPLVIGNNVTKGGNACGQEPDAQLRADAAAGTPIWLPVVNQESGNGSNININVMGFVELSLNFTYPASDTYYPVAYPHPGAASQPSDYTCPASFFGKIIGTSSTIPTGGTETTSSSCTPTPQASCIIQYSVKFLK